MTKHEIIRELAQAVYNDGIKNDTYFSSSADWALAERMYDFFEDESRPSDIVWRQDWEDYQRFYPVYWRYKDDGQTT